MAIPGVSLFDSNGNVLTSTAGALNVSATIVPGTGVTATQATSNVAVPSNASNVTVKATPGRLFSVTVTTVGTVGMQFSDNGVVVFALTAAQAAALGTYQANVQFNTAIVAVGAATNPSVTAAIS
jgi:hypothetical protein